MDKINKILTPINTIALVVIIFMGLVGNQSANFGGDTNFDSVDTTDGYKVDATTVIDGSGNVDAAITSSTGSFTGDVGVGTTSPSNELHVEDSTATSTITVSSGGGANIGGRIILEDSDGAGCSEIYILNGTVISATIACPTGI